MCLIAFAFDCHPDYKLIVAANRDEFYNRPTAPLHWWNDYPEILGGRDKQAGGTWMAANKSGRFAAVTNYRDLQNIRKDALSRGDLPTQFLQTDPPSEQYLEAISSKAPSYNGFNLLVYEQDRMFHFSNYENKINVLSSGIYGLSNALLDTPWPKVQNLKEAFSNQISRAFSHEDLLNLLTDTSKAEDENLPDTGVGLEWERTLSPIQIKSEKYGTCCSTILTISRTGEVQYTEKSYPVGDRRADTVSFNFQL